MRAFPLVSTLALSPLTLLPAHPANAQQPPVKVTSTLNTIPAAPTEQTPTKIYATPANFEAPNYTPNNTHLLFDQAGSLYRIPLTGGTPTPIPLPEGMHCNGSHGLSPDGTLLAISCSSPTLPGSHVYVLPPAGGTPRLVTEHTQSYFHTWSPDSKTIVFTRPDGHASNFLAINVNGGPEKPLTTGTAVNDDPDFSPDGHFIYFNSDRAGTMQIWRMHPDGTALEQLTSDNQPNWTPHPSPDGRWILFLSYAPGTEGHPANQPITLRLMSVKDRKITTLVQLIGGSGTDNTNSWSPDSQHLAYVSYEVQP